MQITANGITLEVEIHGPETGAALILVRGLGTQLIHWPIELIAGFAAAGYRTVIFDNRDTGLSARCPAEGVPTAPRDILHSLKSGGRPRLAYTLDDMARDIVGLMDALGIARAHVLGISMGGAITQLLALDHPSRLLSAIIVMSAAGLRDPALLAQILVSDMNRAEAQEVWVAGHRIWGSPGYPRPEDEIRAEAGRAWDRGAEAAGINRQAMATVLASDRRPRLPSVTTPALVIHGADDRLIPSDASREIAALIPEADLRIIPGMGHVISPSLAPTIVRLVDDFIKKVAKDRDSGARDDTSIAP